MSGRIRYIDALRGTTMFLVVLGHVLVYSLKLDIEFLGLVRMPTFFFISGYIAHKAVERWNLHFFLSNMKKKAMVQLLPTIFFFVAFHIMINGNAWHDFVENGPGRYWFTVTLFEFFVCYFMLSLIGKYTYRWVVPIGMIVISLIALGYEVTQFEEFPKYVFAYTRTHFYYIAFFTMGLLCREHNGRFMRLLDDRVFMAVVVGAFMVLVVYGFGTIRIKPHYDVLKLGLRLLMSAVGVIVLFAFFRNRQRYFDGDSRLARALVFIGRRTLDIYLIHYFFLPQTMWMRKYFIRNALVPELLYAVTITSAIVALCLLVSEFIRLSDFWGHYLLGAKRKNDETKQIDR